MLKIVLKIAKRWKAIVRLQNKVLSKGAKICCIELDHCNWLLFSLSLKNTSFNAKKHPKMTVNVVKN